MLRYCFTFWKRRTANIGTNQSGRVNPGGTYSSFARFINRDAAKGPGNSFQKLAQRNKVFFELRHLRNKDKVYKYLPVQHHITSREFFAEQEQAGFFQRRLPDYRGWASVFYKSPV